MKLDAALVATLSRWLDATDIDRLELSGPGVALTLGRAGVHQLQATPVEDAGQQVDVASPSPGIFLDRHPLASCAAAEAGDEVAEGDLLGCLQVGALLIPVRALAAGLLAARLAEPGTLVGYGAPLFRLQIRPAEEPR